ncbi:hypothetical protein EAG_15863 [Camponotus floridanus]|uniref:Uncharacterized protein n=1 Tax=Camponotus floridanus TaxID=104421 RepID=E2ACP0_CAMFO|nr:hypothetical protein EAG_15863 [Camponotus floridanus]
MEARSVPIDTPAAEYRPWRLTLSLSRVVVTHPEVDAVLDRPRCHEEVEVEEEDEEEEEEGEEEDRRGSRHTTGAIAAATATVAAIVTDQLCFA